MAASIMPGTGKEPGFWHRMSSLLRAAANDFKRDDASADAELGLPPGPFARLADCEEPLSMELLSRVCAVWPLNERDLLPVHDDCVGRVLVYRQPDSLASARALARGGRPYYEYRDTAMSRLASCRPEWIGMLPIVDDNDPGNPNVQWNEGHLLYPFTYFVGPVNYYYRWRGKAYCAPMNIGDSVWGSLFVPHSFTARSGAGSAFILALTYGGDLLGDAQRELAVLGPQAAREMVLPVGPVVSAQAALVRAFMRARMLTETQLCQATKIPAERMARLCAGADLPREDEIHALARALGVSRRDLESRDPRRARGKTPAQCRGGQLGVPRPGPPRLPGHPAGRGSAAPAYDRAGTRGSGAGVSGRQRAAVGPRRGYGSGQLARSRAARQLGPRGGARRHGHRNHQDHGRPRPVLPTDGPAPELASPSRGTAPSLADRTQRRGRRGRLPASRRPAGLARPHRGPAGALPIRDRHRAGDAPWPAPGARRPSGLAQDLGLDPRHWLPAWERPLTSTSVGNNPRLVTSGDVAVAIGGTDGRAA